MSEPKPSTTARVVILRVRSGRARRALAELLGAPPPGYWRFDRPGAEWRECPADRLSEALAITGITRARKADLEGLLSYWA
jgi:hypothetical protein